MTQRTHLAEPVHETEQTEDWLARLVSSGEAAELAGVSRATLWRMQREGVLSPFERTEQGWALYRVADVLAVRRVSPGSAEPGPSEAAVEPAKGPSAERCAEVFDLFEAGHDGASVVRTLRMDPDEVLSLQEKWARLKGAALLVSAGALSKLVSLGLALPRENANGERGAEAIDGEEKLLEAVARAQDQARGVLGPRAATAVDVERWLSVRFVPGSSEQRLRVSAALPGMTALYPVKVFEGSEWDSVGPLSRAAYDAAFHAQKTHESQFSGQPTSLVFDGNFELSLETGSGVHRYWLSLGSFVLSEQERASRTSKDVQRRLRYRTRLEQEEDAEQERALKRKEALSVRASVRKEERKAEAQERAQDRAREQKERAAYERALAAEELRKGPPRS